MHGQRSMEVLQLGVHRCSHTTWQDRQGPGVLLPQSQAASLHPSMFTRASSLPASPTSTRVLELSCSTGRSSRQPCYHPRHRYPQATPPGIQLLSFCFALVLKAFVDCNTGTFLSVATDT